MTKKKVLEAIMTLIAMISMVIFISATVGFIVSRIFTFVKVPENPTFWSLVVLGLSWFLVMDK